MDIDPDDVFRDDDDPDNELYQERDATKEMLVYLVDASPKMFSTICPSEDQGDANHFEVAVRSIAQSLKTQIINRSYDEVAICFFNTREKKNLQDLNGVYVFNVPEREDLDRPTARLIKEFDCIEESFSKQIGSKYGILSGTRDNSLYNALWAAQALLRKGSIKTADKRILLFTNEDDPFGNIKGVTKMDMMRTTLQRAKDAQDLGISIELLPLSRPDDDFNISTFYAELLGLEGNDLAEFKALAGERQRDLSCVQTLVLCFRNLQNFFRLTRIDEISEIKRVSTGHLRLLGFKPLSCLKDYHNLRPSTFVFPSDEVTLFLSPYNNACLGLLMHHLLVL
ncbi:hypothetical protein DH2020_019622 [Rehmannia glutinosa]|uniref:Ku70/Ku80 N-terminal alpha/beta domain-containing protein n=1 Tax=Rehmannia glutinosa TaxID=99300 RepID=A0ABR0WE22_REHGL